MKPIIKLIHKIKDELDQVESYLEGKTEGARILENESKKDAPFYYDFEKNTYIIQDDDYSENLIDKIMNGEVKMDTQTISNKLAIRKEDEVQLPTLKEGSIHKRKDGRWQGKFYDNGIRRCLYAKTKKDIIIKMNKAVQERNRQDKRRLVSRTVILNKWIEQWMQLYKNDIKDASYKDYQFNLVDKVKNHPIGSKQVGHITPMHLDRFFLSIQAPVARARTYMFLKSAFKKLMQNKVIRENPFDYIDPIRKPKVMKKSTPTSGELNDLFDKLKQDNYKLYQFAKFISLTGLRKGEALALRWEDIDSRIHIKRSFSTASGRFDTPKSTASIRSIPVFPEVKEILAEVNTQGERIFEALSIWQTSRHFSNYAKENGFPGLTLHVLRHYFATQCLQAGIAEKVTSAWLGHEDSKVTKDIYQHINTDFETEQLELLAKYRAK